MIYKVIGKNYVNTFLIVLISGIMIQCKEASSEQHKINKRHDTIMTVHDEVMPKMSDIYKLKKKLKAIEEQEKVATLIQDLDEADEVMMAWMHQYKKPSDSDPDAFTYLDNQEKEINVVRTKMLSAISNAQKFLENE